MSVLDDMRRTPWAADVLVGSDLAGKGFVADGVVAAVDMAREGEANPYGVAGRRWVAEEGKAVPIGSGQHGGLGPDETRPFLMLNDGRSSGALKQPTSLTDIAPTIARFLGLPLAGFDGAPLPLK